MWIGYNINQLLIGSSFVRMKCTLAEFLFCGARVCLHIYVCGCRSGGMLSFFLNTIAEKSSNLLIIYLIVTRPWLVDAYRHSCRGWLFAISSILATAQSPAEVRGRERGRATRREEKKNSTLEQTTPAVASLVPVESFGISANCQSWLISCVLLKEADRCTGRWIIAYLSISRIGWMLIFSNFNHDIYSEFMGCQTGVCLFQLKIGC